MGCDEAARAVAFGIQLPVQAQPWRRAEGWEAGAGPDEIAAFARIAEHTGFAYVAAGDHVAIPKDRAHSLSTTWYDCVSTLSYIAALTHRIRLVSLAYQLPLRHPLAVAKQWSTLDALSDGRAVLGVGAGDEAGEFAALGVDFDRRPALLDESLDALRVALAGEYAAHHGEAWAYDEMGVAPGPVQARLPIWVAGSSPAALARAAERGDGWLPDGPPQGGMSAAIARLRELRGRAGRTAEPFTVGALSGPLYVGEPRWDVGRAVHGSAEQVAAFLRALVGIGVDQVQVTFRSRDAHELYDQLRAFGTEVAPLVGR